LLEGVRHYTVRDRLRLANLKDAVKEGLKRSSLYVSFTLTLFASVPVTFGESAHVLALKRVTRINLEGILDTELEICEGQLKGRPGAARIHPRLHLRLHLGLHLWFCLGLYLGLSMLLLCVLSRQSSRWGQGQSRIRLQDYDDISRIHALKRKIIKKGREKNRVFLRGAERLLELGTRSVGITLL